MKKRIILLIQIVSLISFCTGCWNQRELNELSIAMGLGFDKLEYDDKYEVSIQVALPQEVTKPTYYTPVKLYSVKADSLFEAFRMLTKEVPRKIYLPHFRVMVIGEELAKEGISELTDMLLRDHEFRSDFFIVIAKGDNTAKDIMQIMTPFEKIPSQELYSIIETSQAVWAPVLGVKLDELVSDLRTEGKEVVLSGVKVEGSQDTSGESKQNIERVDPITAFELDNIAVFKGNQLVGWLNEEQSKGYNYITNNVESTVGPVKCPNSEGEIIVEVKEVKTKVTGEIKKEKPEIRIETTIKVNIGEVRCKIDLEKPEIIKKIEKNMEERFKTILESSVTVAQEEFKSDIFGFGDTIHKANPEAWRDLKGYWDEEFKELKVSYQVKAEINLVGTIDSPLFDNK